MNQNKIVIITGTSSGLGLHSAIRAAKEGFTVVATMRNPETNAHDLLEKAREFGVTVHVDELDVQKRKSIDACVARTLGTYGQIDVLVNNAGFGMTRFLEMATEEQINEVFDVNSFGVMRCIQAVLPHMRKRRSGRIITISSVAGLVGRPTNEIYCASKFAIEGLMEGLASYLEPYFGIHCSLVEPADIQTNFIRRIVRDLGANVGPQSGDNGAQVSSVTPEFIKIVLGELHADYGQIIWDNLKAFQQEGSLANAQSPEAVAAVVLQAMLDAKPRMRYQSSDFARASCAEKLSVDPDGEKQTVRIRELLLGIHRQSKERDQNHS